MRLGDKLLSFCPQRTQELSNTTYSYDKCTCNSNTLIIVPSATGVGNSVAHSRATGIKKHFRSASCDVKMIRGLLLKDNNCNTLESTEEASKIRNLKNTTTINLSRHNSSDLNVEFRHKFIAHSNSMSIPKDEHTNINQMGGIRYIQNYLKPLHNENNGGTHSHCNHCGEENSDISPADNYCTNVSYEKDEEKDNSEDRDRNAARTYNQECRLERDDEMTTGCGNFVRKHRRNHSYDQIFLPNNMRATDLSESHGGAIIDNNHPQNVYHHPHCNHYYPLYYGRKKNVNLLKNTISFEQGKLKSSNENTPGVVISAKVDSSCCHSRNNSKDLNVKVSHDRLINFMVATAPNPTLTTTLTAATATTAALTNDSTTISCKESVLRHRRTNSKESNAATAVVVVSSSGQLHTGPIANNLLGGKPLALQEEKLIESPSDDNETHLN